MSNQAEALTASHIDAAVRAGMLSPAARDMPVSDVLYQYTEANGITESEAVAELRSATPSYTREEVAQLMAQAEAAPQPSPVYAGMLTPVEWHTLTGGPLAERAHNPEV